jgi:dGTPase
MNWNNLLLPIRFGDIEPRLHDPKSERSIFEQDYDRIIFSTHFRRLQDKTQVIPLPEHDFVHNRLTHSIEVSSVGRTLGKMAAKKLLEAYPNLAQSLSLHDLGAIVAAASLAHDIGNPPFGHSGESAIGDYFLVGNGQQFQSLLNEQEWQDLISFEGNAHGFNILTNHFTQQIGGLRLTYPTLAAFTKYPKASLPKYENPKASQKKYGFFQSEVDIYADIAQKLSLPHTGLGSTREYQRHPFVYLVEAADDICYQIIDFEDGLRLGWIDFDKAESLLMAVADKAFYAQSYQNLHSKEEKAGYLRAVAINNLVKEMATLFITYEKEMLSGNFNASLMSKSSYAEPLKEIKKLSLEKIYKAPQVLEIEAAGFEVIGGLLNYFTNALMAEKPSGQQLKILELLPNELKLKQQSNYLKLLHVCSYVAGFTDKYAISLFKKLKGIELPKW